MSACTCKHLAMFRELVDEILNAVLFVLIGLEVIVVRFPEGIALAQGLTIGRVVRLTVRP